MLLEIVKTINGDGVGFDECLIMDDILAPRYYLGPQQPRHVQRIFHVGSSYQVKINQ